jgi:hypothetical protein
MQSTIPDGPKARRVCLIPSLALAKPRVYAGAIMVIAGIAAFIEAQSNHPVAVSAGVDPNSALGRAEFRTEGGLYD